MEITKKQEGSSVTFFIEGRVDTVTAPSLEEAVSAEFDNANELILDIEKVTYISSAGLRVLFSAHKAMGKKGGMKVIHVCDNVQEVFGITGFSDILTIE